MALNTRSVNNVWVEIVEEFVHVERLTMLQHIRIPLMVTLIYNAIVVQTKKLHRMQSKN